ncbi:MAG: HAMP domain-containing histidine kinase, partial [Burkholderiales bacterium]|nr:HAMP domain-containing histidine kinase [Burkholderiales bacterium]
HAVEGESDLNDSINAVMGIIGDQPHEGIDLRIELGTLPQILCDRGRINQVLLSLVQNAVRALSGKGSVCVSSYVAGPEIKIAVKDNGCGMDEQTLSRIFDPFFTMQDVGKGTGLGLTVSQEIVSSYGGRLEVESKVGVGSTFTISMPISRAK